ncbi:sialic acid TRAP transporter substrate-binding protein SiaP [Alloyangia pacifica]|uniref:Tripartite ATP-independent transporter solute receptor, DctP family n=1 Tax=Alloyangia pacifica TaxID=311180 RepID=A0A1I6VY59_9RHOB|nr:sialic acid TRAP transporter substrate-binding protein SiaP [Alloyangia pacifica]SDI18905.1 tripartite ATP-independent transporter solute receptor, DctP family [Alloyangia pacifica]SFT18646.1 tripartite ATP-independent transporter solute receptor, DctP family [Alloyangia pacifica]
MTFTRTLTALALGTALVTPALAADQIEIKYTTASVPTDLHTKAMQVFKDELEARVPGRFDVQLYDSGSLFAQGADLDALQRGNAEMTYLSYQLIADAIPAYGLLTAGYLFQSPEHYRAFLNSDIGAEFKQTVSDEMDVQLLDTCYLGTRQLNLRSARDVSTPDDLAGLKLRMPGSDAWLFLGSALGAAPTPLPFGEVYLGLQTGTIDAQDNPLPTVEAAKFYEVTEQIVLTSHLVDGINIAINNETWDQLSDEEKTAMTEAAVASCDWNNAERVANEERLVDFFKSEGLQVTEPDVEAFRSHVQEVYFSSDRSADWPEGWAEKINALAE